MANTQDNDQYTDDFADDSYETQEENLDNNENPDEWGEDNYTDDDDLHREDGAENNNDDKKKKKSSLSTIIIIAVAVIGCLGFLVLKFGGGSSPSATPVEQTESAETPVTPADTVNTNDSVTPSATTTTAASAATNVVDASPDTQGFMMAPEKVENIVIKEPEAPPVEALPKEQVEQQPASDSAPSAENLVAQDSTQSTTPPAEFPTVANILKPQPNTKETPVDMTAAAPEELEAPLAPPTVVKQAPETTPPNTPEEPSGTATQALDVTKSKEYLDISKNLELANQKIAELEQKIDNQSKMVAPETTDNSAEIAALQEKIAELQRKLQTQTARTVEQPSPIVRNVIKRPATNKQAVAGYQTASSWTLRSASSGKAILYNQRTSESKSVRIGDNISPIGSITSIEKVDGKWVVKGTSGQISR